MTSRLRPTRSTGRRSGTSGSVLLRALVVAAFVLAVAAVALGWLAIHGSERKATPLPSVLPSGTAPATTKPSSSPTPAHLLVAAWSRGDLASLRAAMKAKVLDEVDTDWWHARADGSLQPESVNPAFVALAHAHHLAVFATITNRLDSNSPFDPKIAEAIIANSVTRERHAELLVELCRTQNYDGIDLDWESLRAADHTDFSAFVKLLATRLHEAGKRLSIAVYDKTSDHPTGPEAGARAAEDYAALGRAVDEFKIMTFGEHGSFTGPGPLSSRGWMAAVLAYAEARVDPAKIYLGVPFYGFDWGRGQPRYLLWSDAQALIATYHPTIQRSASGEPSFNYIDAVGVAHTLYFQDRKSIAAKFRFARTRSPAIAGIAIWVMGGEDPGFWPVLKQNP
jgi:spore germination protein YaaH